VFMASTTAMAEVVPRAIHGSAGMMALSTYSDRYQPKTTNLPVSSVGMDVALTNRWSGSISALMSTDETIAAFGFGGRFHFGQRRVITSGGRNGYVQYTTTSGRRCHDTLPRQSVALHQRSLYYFGVSPSTRERRSLWTGTRTVGVFRV